MRISMSVSIKIFFRSIIYLAICAVLFLLSNFFLIVDKNHFTVEATVDLSSNFYGWVFASGGKMKITAPQEAVDGFQRMLESFSERQPADETPSISIGQVKK